MLSLFPLNPMYSVNSTLSEFPAIPANLVPSTSSAYPACSANSALPAFSAPSMVGSWISIIDKAISDGTLFGGLGVYAGGEWGEIELSIEKSKKVESSRKLKKSG